MTTPDAGSGLQQRQFLDVKSRDDAIATFHAALRPAPLGVEIVPLEALVGRVLASDVAASIDVPPFDRSVVDGFAVIASDLAAASAAAPAGLSLTGEVIACGHDPRLAVAPGLASIIATGGPMPRGADAVVMIERTRPSGDASILVEAPVSPGQNVSFAGSDIARGQTALHAGAVIGARDIGILAAVGAAEALVWRRPRVAILSTGDELVAPGQPLPPAGIYDSNGAIIAASVAENGCEPIRLGVVRDEEAALRAALEEAFASCDAVILSGGTSKGAGDLTYQMVDALGAPGIVVHGVALKPGKPLCLAVCAGKPVVVLPGFPTSAMFTFHDIVAPALRAMAGLPARREASLEARVPVRVPSELGRTEFVMVALAEDGQGPVAHPVGKGSGAVTAFSQADGFIAVDALSDHLAAGAMASVRLFSSQPHIPDLVVMGSHCTGLDRVVAALGARSLSARILAMGSLGGLSALGRGECDVAPIHLLDAESGLYNLPFLGPDMRLIPGWRRLQGIVHRRRDPRFEGRASDMAVAEALSDPSAIMVNRNQGSGTRTLVDRLLKGAKPRGYWNQPRSHNAVAASVAQGRSDWGVAIRPVAVELGLGFIPLVDESYDFAVSLQPRRPAMIAAFEEAVAASGAELARLGFSPSGT